jgi:hypothetical protein
MELTGISAAEIAAFKQPARFKGQGGAIPQPAYDPAKPHPHFPNDLYQNILSMPDAVFAEVTREAEPPVKVAR